MQIKDISEAENIVNTLNSESKQKVLTQITQLLVNNVARAHTADPFSVVSRIVAVLPKDTQQKVLEELNWFVLRQLDIQNIPVFPIFQKLSGAFSDDVKQNVLNEVSTILQSVNRTSNLGSPASPPPPPVAGIPNAPSMPPSPPSMPPSAPPPSAPPSPIGQNQNAFAPQPPQANTIKKFVPSTPSPNVPPPNNLNQRPTGASVELKFSKGLTLTGTFNLKPKDPVDKAAQKIVMPVTETLKYIIPIPTEAAKKAQGNLSTPVEIYQFLKLCDGFKSLSTVYTEGYSGISMLNFIYKTYSVYMAKYILFKKSQDLPQDKEMRLRIGEWLSFLGHIPPEKLDKIVQLHRVSVQTFEANNRNRAASRSGANYEAGEPKGPLFGNFLLDSEIINKTQLNEALMVQLQFNEILSALK
ncbi:MAG: hypothetical protein U0457_03800 [Candidatus Sericytochromatia bacterium]